MGVLSELSISILASIIYDISKVYFNKTRKNKTFTTDSIESELVSKISDEYMYLLQSGEFESFLKTPIIKDVIEKYLVYVISGTISPDLTKIKKPNSALTEDDIIKYLSDIVTALYDPATINSPTNETVRSFFHDFFTLATEILIGNLDENDRLMVFFINKRLIEMSEIMKKMVSTEVVFPKNKYDEAVSRYHKVLKTTHSRAHVYLMDTIDFERFYVPPMLEYVNSKLSEPFDFYLQSNGFFMKKIKSIDAWKYIFSVGNIVYVIGGAGFGKSLFLNKIINDYNQMVFLNSSDYLVIYGDLKFFYSEGDEPLSVVKFLQKSMIKETLLDDSIISLDLVEHYIKSGRCLILLDALDEVEKSKREELHKKVISYFKNENPNNKICITSRDRGFIPEKDVETLNICPLDKSRIEAYVDKIIRIKRFNRNDKRSFMSQSEALMQKGFLSSFLILSLLINIYKAERELPENKLDLYQKCFEYISIKREREKTKKEYDWTHISLMMKENTFMELARMCFPNNSEVGKREIEGMLCSTYSGKYESEAIASHSAECFLEFCTDRTELFVPASEDGKYKFFHRSFFEYFFSLYIFHRMKTAEEVFESLLKFDVDSEVFELTLALTKQKDEQLYQSIIKLMLNSALQELNAKGKNFNVFNILTLSMQIVDDSSFKSEYFKLLNDFSAKIAMSAERIPNQQIIYSFLKRNDDYATAITNKYEKYAQLSIVESFLGGISRAEGFIAYINNTRKYKKEKEIGVYLGGFGISFFSRLYREKEDYSSVVYDLTAEKLEQLLNNCSATKKEKTKCINAFTKFQTKSEKERTAIMDVILRNKYCIF